MERVAYQQLFHLQLHLDITKFGYHIFSVKLPVACVVARVPYVFTNYWKPYVKNTIVHVKFDLDPRPNQILPLRLQVHEPCFIAG